MPEASENGDENDSDEEDKDGDTNNLEISDNLQKAIFTNAENKPYPNGWISVNELQLNEDVLGLYQQPHFNPNKLTVVFKLLISLSH